MNLKDKTTLSKPDRIVCAPGHAPPKALSIDLPLFMHHLDQWEASEEKKAEYLKLIWEIVVQFVDLGYGIHPLSSLTQQSCGQLPEAPSSPEIQGTDVVKWKEQFNTKATRNAAVKCAAEREKP